MEEMLSQFAVIVLVLLLAYVLTLLYSSDGEWQADGNRMRRKVGGVWQYRDMTDAERDEAFALRQW